MSHIPTVGYPVCPICTEHVELETANTDERGKAVHEECYVAKIILNAAPRRLRVFIGEDAREYLV